MPTAGSRLRVAGALFLVGILLDLGLQSLFRPLARDGVYFHPWSSETMMQTVSIRDLRDDPGRSLLYNHIQPPALDLLRAALAQLWPSLEIHETLRRVDNALLILWALVFGMAGSLVFLMLSRDLGVVPGAVAAGLFLIHPAALYYATFLDATFLTAFLVLLLLFLLQRLGEGARISEIALAMVSLGLFLTRSIFQWPWLIVLAVSLALLGMAWRRLTVFLLITASVSGLFMAKQYHLFGSVETSSFTGYSLSNSIGAGMDAASYSAYLPEQQQLAATYGDLPAVLLRKTKLDGLRNFNNIAYLQLNRDLLERYRDQLRATPPGELLRSYLANLTIYFQPSSEYRARNVLVDGLAWKGLYDTVFSAPILPVLLTLAAVSRIIEAWRGRSLRRMLGVALPVIFIGLSSILFDKGENMRFKFWLEPAMYVFILSSWPSLTRLAGRNRRGPEVTNAAGG